MASVQEVTTKAFTDQKPGACTFPELVTPSPGKGCSYDGLPRGVQSRTSSKEQAREGAYRGFVLTGTLLAASFCRYLWAS